MSKRILDLLILFFSAPFVLPLLCAIAVIVKFRMGSPIIFKQQRPGKNGELFQIAKFRTMGEGNDSSGNPLPDSDRITPFGKWLRSTSLDELPELWNILKGEMSFVGPRPLLVVYLERYSERQAKRHNVLPGLTGWAQINGRNAIDWQKRLEMDVWYVENQSIALDLKILFLTVWAVIRREGISAEGEATVSEFKGND